LENVTNFIAQNWRNIIIPIAVFSFCFMALLQLRKKALIRLWLRTKDAKWPADIVLYYPIKRPFYILCIIISAFLGLATSTIPDNWKSVGEHSLSTLFVFTVVLVILSVLNGLILFLGKRLALPARMQMIRTITNIAIIAFSVLVVLGIWGVPTTPVLLLIAVASVLILLTLRDAAPNFFAGLQLMTWQHIKVGDLVKLENSEEGQVMAMGWHNTQIQTAAGDNLIIPNSQLTRQRVVKVAYDQKKTTYPVMVSVLTDRELEIATLISNGSSNKDIAEKLFIAENTVKVHVRNALKKLGFNKRQQLAVYAIFKERSKSEISTVK
jgi:small-conductance mechanosensitive channel